MTKSKSARVLAWLLGAAASHGACTGTIEGTLGPSGAGGASPQTGGPDGAGPDGDGSGAKAEPGGIGTQVFALCDGAEEAPSPRLLRLLTRREYRNTVRDLLFIDQPDVSNLPLEPRVRGFDNNALASVVTSRHIDEYLTVAQTLVQKAVQEKKGQLLSCQPSDASCARTFVEKFGLRAFRRPLSGEESTRYQALFAPDLTEGNFDEGLRLAMTSMLVSANFLYRSELGEPAGNGTFELTPYEVASALSYLYWGSMPDQALFDAAGKNALGTQAELETQARRLLADNRAKDQLGEFSLQWLRSDNVLSAFKDQMIYPAFNDSLRTAMVEEQRRFITDLALARDGKFEELFLADYVMANAELAKFYGLNGGGNDFGKLAVTPESERGGVLGLGAVLAAHAHSNESSPIKRGVFVRDRLLCQDLPPPPPNLDTTPPGLDPTLTTRVRFAKHTESTVCSGCHQYIDGVGFGFEGFDGIGQKRTLENGMPIDTSGALVGREGLGEDSQDTFRGPRELAALLADSPSAKSCLTLQYYRFARGYEETENDACSLSKLKQRFEDKDLTVKELLVNLALLDSFTLRGE